MKTLTVLLPLPCSDNAKTRFSTQTRRVYTTQKARGLRKEIILRIEVALSRAGIKFTPQTKTRLHCFWHRPDMRSDVVNFHKEACDCIKQAIGVDDRYFVFAEEDYDIMKDCPDSERLELTIMQED